MNDLEEKEKKERKKKKIPDQSTAPLQNEGRDRYPSHKTTLAGVVSIFRGNTILLK